MAVQALPKSSWVALLFTILLAFRSCALLSPHSPSCSGKNTTLYLAAMAPFPDSSPGLDPGWSGGPAVIPGSQLAVRHINSKCDILEDFKLELLVGDSGCNVMSKATINLTSTLFHLAGGKRIIGIVGPGCSEATKVIGRLLANPAISLLNIAPSATSPELVDSVTYPNTFRPIASSLGFINMYAELVRLMGYTKVAILFEAERTNHIEAARQMMERLRLDGIDVASFGMFGRFSIPLTEIIFRYRIVFVFGGGGISRQLMCLAYRKSMIYPTYQFIFSERRLNHFTSDTGNFRLDGEEFSCTKAEMKRAIPGIVLSQIRLTRQDQEMVLENGMTYNDFYAEYEAELTNYVEELGINKSDIVDTEHESGYYDSTWALALSYQAAISALKNDFNMSLSEYGFGQPEVTDIIREQLLDVRFEGIRGKVKFSSDTLDGVDVTVLDMFQVTNDPESPELRVATYSPRVNISESNNGSKSTLSINDQSAFIQGFFPDEFISPPIYIEILVLITTAVIAITTFAFHFATMKWNNLHSLKATSPALNHMIFSGCYLYILSIVFLSFQQLDTTHDPVAFGVGCSSFIWCESLALTLIFGTICVKTWRVFRIFSHSSAKVLRHLEDYRLVLYVSGFLLIDIIFNLAWNLMDPWYMHLAGQERLKMRVICNCDNVIVWLSCLLGLKALLTFAVLYLSIATRRIPKKEYKQTKSTNALVYCLIFLYAFTIPVYLILLSKTDVSLVTVSYVALCFKNITCIILCTVFIFIPPVLPIMKTEIEVMTTRSRSVKSVHMTR